MSDADLQQRIDPDAAFERDVPETLRDDLYQRMSDATASSEGDDLVSIHDHERINALNSRASGTVRVGDVEFAFEMENGDRNGTVLLHWGLDERVFERSEPVLYAVQPTPEAIARSIEAGRVPLFLAKWDAIAAQPQVAELLRAYGHDRYFAPGGVTETHWRTKAARMGLVIVHAETAAETRRSLEA